MAERSRRLVLAGALAAALIAGAWAVGDRSVGTNAAVPVADGPACGATRREPADGAGRHIDRGALRYQSAPPAVGDHRSRWAVGAEHYYDVRDRPPVPVLVHNLEHGYNILWYDDSVAEDAEAIATVKEIADEYASLHAEADPTKAFIAAPWTAADGNPFPDGARFALTHWYLDADDPGVTRADEMGVTRYCAGISAEIVRTWMRDFPLRDSPEGYPDLM